MFLELNIYKCKKGLKCIGHRWKNKKSDEFLEKHNFTREEIKTGLMDITDRYGVSDLAETFLDMEE